MESTPISVANPAERRDPRFPLREWNQARRKVGLAFALRDRLPHQTLEEIPVQELCDAVGVAPATFFNYFPRKVDVIVYLAQLVAIDLSWHAEHRARGSALGFLEAFFDRAAELVAQYPWAIQEIHGHQTLLRERPPYPEPSPAERVVAYGDLAGVEQIGVGDPLPAIFREQLAVAVARRELSTRTDVQAVADLLFSIFFGVPVLRAWEGHSRVAQEYRRQLTLVWRALRGARPVRRR